MKTWTLGIVGVMLTCCTAAAIEPWGTLDDAFDAALVRAEGPVPMGLEARRQKLLRQEAAAKPGRPRRGRLAKHDPPMPEALANWRHRGGADGQPHDPNGVMWIMRPYSEWPRDQLPWDIRDPVAYRAMQKAAARHARMVQTAEAKKAAASARQAAHIMRNIQLMQMRPTRVY